MSHGPSQWTITWNASFQLYRFLRSPYGIGHTIIFLPCGFFFLLSFPPLISAVADWMSAKLPHMVWLSANLECRSEMYCTRLAGNAGRKRSPSGHHRTTLSGYIFATKARTDNRKYLLSSNISSTSRHNMVNFSLLAAEIDFVSLGHPS